MIKRNYFINARCSEGNSYCYQSSIVTYSSIFPDCCSAFNAISNQLKQELLSIRPNGNFEVMAFNRV